MFDQRLTVTGGILGVTAHCTCGWHDTVPAGTAWGQFAWVVSQHANTHRPTGALTAQGRADIDAADDDD